MADGTSDIAANTHAEWLAHVQPTGLVVAASVLDDLVSAPARQTAVDNAEVLEALEIKDARAKDRGPYIADAWGFVSKVLGWDADFVAGVDGGPPLPDVEVVLEAQGVTLRPDWVVVAKVRNTAPENWLLFVQVLPPGAGLDKGGDDGWEATPSQQMERLLRETGAPAGLIIGGRTLRLITAPRGESSGWMDFPVQALTEVAGRPMLSGLKQLVGKWGLYLAPKGQSLPDLITESRKAQANVSKDLAAQVLGALHALLRGLTAAMPKRIGDMAADPERSHHLYEGLLTVLMRLVFLLYAEDRDLLPSTQSGPALELYDRNYSVRGLLAKLEEDEARYPATMADRVGAWGRLLALFRLVYEGDRYGWIQARGGKLFSPDVFPFLEARERPESPASVPRVPDACVLEVLRALMRLKGDRLSYRTLDVEQIGSVYETVMGFTVQTATGPSLAIQAGKKNHTPVFVDLAALTAVKPAERLKWLKTHTDRDKYPAAMEEAIKTASSVEGIAAAFETGRGVVDERGSPGKRIIEAGTPILQPTDERRRSGSHYTPRSLTEPIVRHTLEPAFERLGPDATAEQILELKVCDPAMGSGAFLVEACRQLGARLEAAWVRWPASKPTIPPDEDETLHARRLASQRCLYGVDKNPMATDLARLSLWLATLARDHEFTFLDHALKSGDSLVGLTDAQIAAANWDEAKPGLPLFRMLVRERVAEAQKARAEIQSAPDDTSRVIQEARHRHVETRLSPIRVMGDAVVSAFFAADKAKAREKARANIESQISGMPPRWDRLEAAANSLRAGEHGIAPFHWQLEFPEVFARENGGFDAIVGNPPFAGKNTIIGGNAKNYLPWLQMLHEGAHGNADLVAHFFRRAFGLLRQGGVFGLIATNTIGQGDTRASGLTSIIAEGGAILQATRRRKWPGEAAVVVSVVHVVKGAACSPMLDMRPVRRISAYLVEGELDTSPEALAANSGKAFQGSIVLGMGFTFDDAAAAKGEASSLDEMRALIDKDPCNAQRIFPYIGGEEVNTHPEHAHHRYVIDFADFPLARAEGMISWAKMTPQERAKCRTQGIVPLDYSEPVAEDWPDLLDIIRRLVKPERDPQERKALRERWWQYAEKRPGLYRAISPLDVVIATNCGACPHSAFELVPANMVFAHSLAVIAFEGPAPFATLQSRPHELWARFFSSTLEDRLRYAPSDCFRTFPFPIGFETDPALEAIGEAYYAHRANLMIARNQGLTKTYNRFHDAAEMSPDIVHLRDLHAEMDRAVLAAYGWLDLAARAEPKFIEQDADEGKTPKTRLDWPADFKDEVLAHLLGLNGERAAAERAAGIVAECHDGEEFEEGAPSAF